MKNALLLSSNNISTTFLSYLESKDRTVFSIFLHARDRNNAPVNLCFWGEFFLQQLSFSKGECNFTPTIPYWKGGALIAGNTLVISSYINYDQLAGRISVVTKMLDRFFYETERAIFLILGENQFLYQPVVITATTFD